MRSANGASAVGVEKRSALTGHAAKKTPDFIVLHVWRRLRSSGHFQRLLTPTVLVETSLRVRSEGTTSVSLRITPYTSPFHLLVRQ